MTDTTKSPLFQPLSHESGLRLLHRSAMREGHRLAKRVNRRCKRVLRDELDEGFGDILSLGRLGNPLVDIFLLGGFHFIIKFAVLDEFLNHFFLSFRAHGRIPGTESIHQKQAQGDRNCGEENGKSKRTNAYSPDSPGISDFGHAQDERGKEEGHDDHEDHIQKERAGRLRDIVQEVLEEGLRLRNLLEFFLGRSHFGRRRQDL